MLVSLGINSRTGMNVITSQQIYTRGEAQVTDVSNPSDPETDMGKPAWEYVCACQSHFPSTHHSVPGEVRFGNSA